MIALWGFLRGPARAALGGLPRSIWYIFSGITTLLLLWHWHERRIDAAYAGGATAQASIDRAQFEAATTAAGNAQHQIAVALAASQCRISKGSDDALLVRNADLARRYDDLRLRWAAYRAHPGGSGRGGATTVPGAAAIADNPACAAAGWVSFDTAAAAAQAADTAIAKDDAWIAWAANQMAVWPVSR